MKCATLTLAACVLAACAHAATTVSLKPSRDDCSAAFLDAIARVRAAGGGVIELEKGAYHFAAGTAQKHVFHVTNHDQSPDHPVNLPFVGVTNLTLRGHGSTLTFHGATIGVLVRDSAGVRLEGVKLDWSRPFITEMKILGFKDGKTIGRIDKSVFPYVVENGHVVAVGEGWKSRVPWGMVFRGDTHEIVERSADLGYDGAAVENADGTLTCDYDYSKAGAGARVGDVAALRPERRPFPACVLYHAKDVVFEDVAIHTAWGMGVIAQMSENFTWRGTGRAEDKTSGVFPPAGSSRVTTLHADASHFANVKGAVTVENCFFETMMDDAANVHCTCLAIVKILDKRRIRCRYMHRQAVGYGAFDPGDALRFIRGKTLENGAETRVLAVDAHDEREVTLLLADDLPPDCAVGDAVENADYQPSVVFRGNVVKNNRARGVLFTTPKPIVCESNLFDHVSGSAILFAGDAQGWYESGACTDVLVRGNVFRDCLTSVFQFCDGVISSWPMIRDFDAQKVHYHRNFRIEDNLFETFDVPLLYARSTDDITFRGNRIRRHDRYRGWGKPPFILEKCDRALVCPPTPED
ncbi:MAG: hypothetical protein MJ138_00645 [Kiritimatiellae bacterium]|nr:hypothetical protein [Kiritimatiellia bacterium]